MVFPCNINWINLRGIAAEYFESNGCGNHFYLYALRNVLSSAEGQFPVPRGACTIQTACCKNERENREVHSCKILVFDKLLFQIANKTTQNLKFVTENVANFWRRIQSSELQAERSQYVILGDWRLLVAGVILEWSRLCQVTRKELLKPLHVVALVNFMECVCCLFF